MSQASEAAVKVAREWLKHAHGEEKCPYDSEYIGSGDEKCLAALLDKFTRIQVARARLEEFDRCAKEFAVDDVNELCDEKAGCRQCNSVRNRLADLQAQLKEAEEGR